MVERKKTKKSGIRIRPGLNRLLGIRIPGLIRVGIGSRF